MRTELIQASELLRKNTPEAVEEAIGLLQNTVFSFSMKMCGHRQDAEDTAHEVLFRSSQCAGRVALHGGAKPLPPNEERSAREKGKQALAGRSNS